MTAGTFRPLHTVVPGQQGKWTCSREQVQEGLASLWRTCYVRCQSATTSYRDGPWCTNQRGGRTDADPRPGSHDADGLWAAEFQHPIQGTNGEGCSASIILTGVLPHPWMLPDSHCRPQLR